MRKKGFIIFSLLFSVVFGQNNNNETLFTIAGDNVSVNEFVRVYTKNNINNQADFSKASLDEYLDLYEKFRLKVKEAESLGMDTVKSFLNELASYRGQLTQSYLSDRKATDKLTREAFDRLQEEVEVSHILIFWPNSNPSKADSMVVLNKLLKIKAAAKKTSFEDQIVIYNKSSKDKYPGNKQKYEGGKLGYITAFQTVYPFESAMYNTKVGEISEPTATRFGYHLLYVSNKRAARGKITTAHILIKSKENDSPENQKIASEKALEIYKEIKNASLTFEEAVIKYSEDKKTKYQRGEVKGERLLDSYLDAAYTLQKDNDITKPIKTAFGWHIIKRIKKEDLATFDFLKSDIEKKVERDSRSNVAKKLMVTDTKKQFGFTKYDYAKDNVINALKNAYNKGTFKIDAKNYTQTLFRIGKRNISQADFIKHVKSVRSRAADDVNAMLIQNFNTFLNKKIIEYRADNLEDIDVDFKNLIQEYHDGILLFELTNKEVWTKAVEDTLGLQNFYNLNKENYVWKDRVAVTSYNVEDAKTAKKVKSWLKRKKSKAFITSKLGTLVKTESKKIELESNDFVKSLNTEKGEITVENNLDGSAKITIIEETIAPIQKELSETKGYVISDYQDYLEKNWINVLRKKFPIELNKEVFKALIK